MTDLPLILPEPISALVGVLTAALILFAAVLIPFLFHKKHMLRAYVPWLAMAVLVFAAAAVTGIQSSAAQCMMGSTDRPHPVSTCDELITAITRPKGTDCDTPGSIYTAILKLEENFTGTCDITIADDVYAAIDLNGQTLKGTGSGSVITVNGTLTLMDSREGGTITGGNAEKGGGVFVEGESFTMKGGNISGNNASMTGGGVEVSFGSFTMSGGEISGNTASLDGGGVYVETAGEFKVHSFPKVIDNTTGGNVFLPNGKVIYVIDQLSDEARLGITMESPGVFTSGLSDTGVKSNFSSDDKTYDVGVNADGEAILIPKNKYTVKFVNYDGSVLQSTSEVEGTTPKYIGKTPAKPADAQYTYSFTGWSPAITEVTKDQTYTATYSSSLRNYNITFVDEDGKSVLKDAVQYPYGTAAADIVKPVDPTRSADAKYSYTFAGWSPAITEVTGDQTYKATYSRTVREYLIRFLNDNGDVLQSSQVPYGEKPVYKGKTPEKAASGGHTYAFAGWDKEIVACTGPKDYTATYITDSEVFTIRFLNEGIVLQSDQMAYLAMPQYTGETPVKAASEEYTYRFEGWTPEFIPVIMDADYKAVFSSWKYMLDADYRDPEGTAIGPAEDYLRGSKRDKVYRFVLTQQNSNTNLLNKFNGLRMDGDPNPVDPSYYEASEGSLIIRLKAEYLELLSAGNHTLTAIFTDGEVNAPCNVVENDNTFPIPVEFVFIQYDGSYGVPSDIKAGMLRPVIIIKDGEKEISRSAAVELKIPPDAPENPVRQIADFSKEVKDLAPGKYAVTVSGLPKEMARDVPDGDAPDAAKIRLTAKAEINIKSGKPVIMVYLTFDGRIAAKYEEPVVYALPEDEIGAYWLRKDGTKEYLLFHTYDICMTYLGKEELCEGPERCFHKDGK